MKHFRGDVRDFPPPIYVKCGEAANSGTSVNTVKFTAGRTPNARCPVPGWLFRRQLPRQLRGGVRQARLGFIAAGGQDNVLAALNQIER